jgi:2-hydroxy-3-keto-5-methylthiopentenyl-1-phosphate phosphatase
MSNSNKKEAIIVDIDGTLANCDHRRHFVDGTHGKQDWKSFYDGMETDTVNKWCKFIIDSCVDDFAYMEKYVLLVSGRPEKYRKITLNWLEKNGVYSGECVKL